MLSDVGVKTIDDVANWAPFLTAKRVLDEALGGGGTDAEERDAERLRPRIGEYPTERVYYDTLVMLESGDGQGLTPIKGAGRVPLDALFQPPNAVRTSPWAQSSHLRRVGTCRG